MSYINIVYANAQKGERKARINALSAIKVAFIIVAKLVPVSVDLHFNKNGF